MLRTTAALVVTACLVVFSGRSATAADVDERLDGLSLTSWHDDAGHPLGSVYAVVQDHDGYIWIGTDAGLRRFDGWRFTPWERLLDSPVPEAAVRALTFSRDGGLWLGLGDGGGVAQVRDRQLVSYNAGLEGLDAVTDIVEDGRGVMWAVADRMLFTLHADGWQRVRLPWRTREGLVQHLHVSRSGQLWVGTRWGVFTHRETTNDFQQVSDQHVWGLAEDATGGMWITDIVAGFRPLDAATAPRHASEGAGYRLMFDPQGDLWVATFGHGLWHVRRRGGDFAIERATLRTGLSSSAVQSMLADRDGNVWVGTTAGLHRLTRRELTPLEDVGFVLVVDSDGRDVVAGTTNGLIRLEGEVRGQWRQVRVGGAMPDVRSFLREPGGTLWVGASDGLWRYADGRLSHVSLPSRSEMLVRWLTPDRQRGGLWLGDGEWLYRWDGRALSPLTLSPTAADLTRVTFARTDRSGRLWLGFGGQAIGRIDLDGTFRPLGPSEGFTLHANQLLHAVHEDAEGVVWLGTSHGVYRLAGGRATRLGRANGLPSDRVWAIVEDESRDLWLSLDRGVVRVPREELAQAVHGPHRLRYRVYEPRDGLAGAPIGIIDSWQGPDGGLWFIRGGGLTYVEPRTLKAPSAPPSVLVEEAVANEQRLDLESDTSLAAGTKRLQVSYAVVAGASANRIRFRYRLEGFDADWVEAGVRRTAYYTNLSPGTYRFLVEGQSDEGIWATSTAEWRFTIEPAFYQTSWFYTGGAVGALSLVGLGWHFRLQFMRRQFSLVLAERARLSREIHDTLLQSLVGVALQFDGIAAALDPSSTHAHRLLTRTRRQVEAYIRDARQSIWDLRSPVLETRDLSTALRDFARKAIADGPIRFSSSTSGVPRLPSHNVENQLLRIGQEAITNAIRHARATRIDVDLAFGPSSVRLCISDDGCGFDSERAADIEGHYGLATMRERAEELGGTLMVRTAVGRGTTVEAVVPSAMSVAALSEAV